MGLVAGRLLSPQPQLVRARLGPGDVDQGATFTAVAESEDLPTGDSQVQEIPGAGGVSQGRQDLPASASGWEATGPLALGGVHPDTAADAISTGFGQPAGAALPVPGRLLVKLKPEAVEADFSVALAPHGAQLVAQLPHSLICVLSVPDERLDAALSALRNDPNIKFAERDYYGRAAVVPNDPCVVSGSEWHLNAIQTYAAWDITMGKSNVVVAVVDSGISFTHPDLTGRLVSAGYDFVSGTNWAADDYGHGTEVAGVVGATANNGVGVAGVAPGCQLLPVKVMDQSGFAAYSAIAAGIDYAVDHGARVINISIVGSAASSTLQDAVNYAWSRNVLVVAAAGNSATNTVEYPAGCSNVVAVSATSPGDTLASFSSYGDDIVLAAPGDGIWTTYTSATSPYYAFRGTSLASPMVAGVAALMWSANSSLANTQVVALLEQSADDLGAPGYDIYYGYGLVNAARAVAAALGGSTNTAASPPVIDTTPPATGAVTPATPATTTPDLPPQVLLTRPTPGSALTLGTTVPVSASASSSNTTITNLEVYVNGVKAAGGRAAALNYNWRPLQPGAYVLTVAATDGRGQRATTAPAQVLVADRTTPSITITSAPPNYARLNGPAVRLAGTARDNVAVDRVEVQLNDSPYLPADGTNIWSTQLVLTAGKNTVHIRSVDLAGNTSTVITRVFTWVVLVPVTVRTNGLGAVTPGLDGKLLEIGKSYSIRALPAPGQLFTGWPGQSWQNASLNFVMQSNLVLVANFVPNPFLPVKGSYAGLVYDTNGVLPATSGQFSLQLANAGGYSARFNLGTRSYSISGQFDLSGRASATIRRLPLSPLAVNLSVDLAKGTGQVSGSVSDGTWTADAFGDLGVFNSRLNPAPQAGTRPFALRQVLPDGTVPAASGTPTNTARISAGGGVTLSGMLADRRRFNLNSTLARGGEAPCYLSLSNGREVMIGWLNFPQTPTNAVLGTIFWTATGTNAFATSLRAGVPGQ